MNTQEQAILLATKAKNTLDKNEGEFSLTFFDGTIQKVKILNINSFYNESGFSCSLTTFTNDINDTTRYDIYELKDIA